MTIPMLHASDSAAMADFFNRLARRDGGNGEDNQHSVEETVRSILDQVRTRGLEAVVEYTRRFDAPDFTANYFAVSQDELNAVVIPDDDARVIAQAINNVTAFHERQRQNSWLMTKADGSVLGQMITPVDRAGLYVPGGKGGTTPLISSLIMNAVPARIAGVPELVVISPPRSDGSINPHIIATARQLGICEVYAAGSAWAIAALAFGAGTLQAVDVITGPGNIFVTTAKRLLIGKVGIDMIAGPSEVCIVADSSANPAWIAADLLSQAEHDPLSSAVCITSDEATGRQVPAELDKALRSLPRRDIASDSLRNFGAVIVVANVDEALELANTLAPEHLELLIEAPWEALPKVRHAGAVFLGHSSAEPLGDYYAGPNHVLPTMGTARFSSALSVETFCKKTSVIAASPAFARHAAEPTARLARLEGLEAHALSALCRLNSSK